MANDLNRCDFIGRLGNDPESRAMPNGSMVVNISLACGESWNDKQSGQKQERTEWVRIVAFNKLAEIMEKYLSKGSKIYVSGKMKTRKWQDNNGQDRYTTEIIANEMQMLDSRGDDQPGGQSRQPPQRRATPQNQQAPEASYDDDIPF